MKVLVIPNGFEANYTLGFLRGLLGHGITPVVVSYQEINAQIDAMGIEHINMRPDQSPKRRVWQKTGHLLRYYVLLMVTVWRHRHLPLHFTGVFNRTRVVTDALLFGLLGRTCSPCFYYTVHNVLPHQGESSRWLRWWYGWFYRLPHRLVVHTPAAADQLRNEFGVSAQRLITISIGLNEEVPRAPVSQAEARRQLKLSPRNHWYLFFGKTDPYKGLDILLAAWRNMMSPDARLAIVGACPDEAYRKKIQALIQALPTPDAVIWHEGFVTNEELGLWLAAADAGVLPYRHIYQSGVIFLYLQHGLPILASDVGALREFIPAAHRQLVPPHDVGALANALVDFLPRAAAMDREALQREAQQYAWPHVIRPLVHHYATLPPPVVV